MRILALLFVLLYTLLINSIAFAWWWPTWDEWYMVPARYESTKIKDPAMVKYKDQFTKKDVIWDIFINSAIIPIEDFKWNIYEYVSWLSKTAKWNWNCTDSTTFEEDNKIWDCDIFWKNNSKKIEEFLDIFLNSSKEKPKQFNIFMNIFFGWLNATEKKAEFWSDQYYYNDNIFLLSQWYWDVIWTYTIPDWSIFWVQKLYWGDNPLYTLFHLSISKTQILFQQSELIPSQTLYYWIKDSELNKFLKKFDENLKIAIDKWFIFKSSDFQKRYALIKAYFKLHEVNLNKKFENKDLSKYFKIENNVVRRYVWNWVWKFLATDIDPNTVKIFTGWYTWIDKHWPFEQESNRLIWWDGTFYSIHQDSWHIWAKKWSDKVYTFKRYEWLLKEIPNVSLKKLKIVDYTSFSDKSSLCKAKEDYYWYYAYDDNYCYWSSDWNGYIEISWVRK